MDMTGVCVCVCVCVCVYENMYAHECSLSRAHSLVRVTGMIHMVRACELCEEHSQMCVHMSVCTCSARTRRLTHVCTQSCTRARAHVPSMHLF